MKIFQKHKNVEPKRDVFMFSMFFVQICHFQNRWKESDGTAGEWKHAAGDVTVDAEADKG